MHGCYTLVSDTLSGVGFKAFWPEMRFVLLTFSLVRRAKGTLQATEDSKKCESHMYNKLHFGVSAYTLCILSQVSALLRAISPIECAFGIFTLLRFIAEGNKEEEKGTQVTLSLSEYNTIAK